METWTDYPDTCWLCKHVNTAECNHDCINCVHDAFRVFYKKGESHETQENG